MLKKGQPLTLSKPGSMQKVWQAITNGCNYRREILKATKLKEGQVTSALNNLVYVGMVALRKDSMGRTIYVLPCQSIQVCDGLRGVAWVFGGRFTTVENETPVSKRDTNTREDSKP